MKNALIPSNIKLYSALHVEFHDDYRAAVRAGCGLRRLPPQPFASPQLPLAGSHCDDDDESSRSAHPDRDDESSRIRQEHGEFVRWRDVPFFFAAAFPTLFVPAIGTDDVPSDFVCKAVRQQSPTFVEFAKHLLSVPRYAAHPSLHFVLKGIKDSEAGLDSMSVAVSQSPDEAPLVRAKALR